MERKMNGEDLTNLTKKLNQPLLNILKPVNSKKEISDLITKLLSLIRKFESWIDRDKNKDILSFLVIICENLQIINEISSIKEINDYIILCKDNLINFNDSEKLLRRLADSLIDDEKKKTDEILKFIEDWGQIDGSHHKMWVITEIVKKIVPNYQKWKEKYEEPFIDEDGEEDHYSWDEGIPP